MRGNRNDEGIVLVLIKPRYYREARKAIGDFRENENTKNIKINGLLCCYVSVLSMRKVFSVHSNKVKMLGPK